MALATVTVVCDCGNETDDPEAVKTCECQRRYCNGCGGEFDELCPTCTERRRQDAVIDRQLQRYERVREVLGR